MSRAFVIRVCHVNCDAYDFRIITRSTKKIEQYKQDLIDLYGGNFSDDCPYCEQGLCTLKVDRVDNLNDHTNIIFDRLYEKGEPSKYVPGGFEHLLTC